MFEDAIMLESATTLRTTMRKIGTVCKWIDTVDQIESVKAKDDAKKYNTCTTTVAWLNRQTREVAEQKLWDLMVQNIESVRLLIQRIGSQEEPLRMLRLSSEVFPCYTEPKWNYFWKRPDVRQYAEHRLAIVGDTARGLGVRLSFHPGPFTVLASHRDDIVDLSIDEVEYHCDMVRWMGYGKSFQDFKVNIHISGKRGPDGVRAVYGRLSPEARNCLTIENEEMTHGLDQCLSIGDLFPIVLDIHHHWCREGEYIKPDDPRVSRVIDSWRGVRPVIHYSVSREDILPGHPTDKLPCYTTLVKAGCGKTKLRAHSDFYWNTALNDWALDHWQWSDIMCECKSKNIGSRALWEYAVAKNK